VKIGVDIDNTITHTTEMIMHYARIFGEKHGLNTVADPSYYYLEDALGWERDIAEHFLDVYLPDIYREMRPKDQAVEVMRQLKDEHELVLITSRNQKFPEVEQVTLEWLERYGIAYDGLILNATPNKHFFSKLGVCKEQGIEIMIEDHHDLIMELAQAFPVIVFDYPYNRHINAQNVYRVTHWQEVLERINQLAAKRSAI